MINKLLKEKSVWEKLLTTTQPLVLYGMGDGADRVLDELNLLNVEVSAVMASDDFVRGQQFRGFTVKTLSQVKEEFSDFIILIAFGSNKKDVMANIVSLSKEYEILVPSVPVAGGNIFNRGYLIRNGKDIMNAYELMADDESKIVFEKMCYFQFTGVLDYLFEMESSKDDAFKILNLNSQEHYLDLGAYRGDTIEEFLKYTCNQYETITAIEPDPKTFKKLTENTENLKNCTLLNMGIWCYDTEIAFIVNRGKGNNVSSKNGVVANVTGIDTLSEKDKFTYIKMDIEGVEFVALSGGMKYLASNKPKLNVACYHRCSDIFRLTSVIHRANPDYKIYMRLHPYIPCWDTNLYCI